MPIKLDVTNDIQLSKIDFNKEVGIKALDLKNKFIGLDTADKSFQSLFKGDPKIQKLFTKTGYSENFSKGFDVGPVSVDASIELIVARIYAKIGVLIERAGYTLGGVTVKNKQSGSYDVTVSAPPVGNGIELSAKTIAALSGSPELSVEMPDAYLKANLIADLDIGALALDGKIKGSIKGANKSIDLPRIAFVSGIKTTPPISIPLIDFSIPKLLAGTATGLYGKKQTKKAVLETEINGIKISADARKFAQGLKVSGGNLSGEFPVFTTSFSLNKLGSKAYPALKLLADRYSGNGYDINYRLLDVNIASDLKLKYDGKLQLSGARSTATFENNSSINLSASSNGFSDKLRPLNTTELRSLLDANGDGKASIRFDQVVNQAGFALNYGLYANLSSTIDAGKFSADVDASIKILGKKRGIKKNLIDINLLPQKKLQLLKDFKLIGGSKTIGLPIKDYQFSKTVTFDVSGNPDDLIVALGLNPSSFYTVRGTSGSDNLVTRTERGNDTFYDNGGVDTIRGGRGNDTYYISYSRGDASTDIVVEDADSGFDIVITSESYNLPDNVEVLDSRAGNTTVNLSGNSLDNIMYAPTSPKGTGNPASVLYGKDGNDTLIGGTTTNSLAGGAGADRLTGGTGVTYFGFSMTDVAGASIDTITDFQSNDFIFFDENLFPQNSLQLELGTEAYSDHATILYDRSTGSLAYDSDGKGGASATVFARLENRPELNRSNLLTLAGFGSFRTAV